LRESITIIKKENVFNTRGSYPVLVYCDDLSYYVVKYKRNRKATNLFNEYIGASFLKLWDLAIPDFEFIDVKNEHVPLGLHSDISPHYFESTCFGSKFSRSYSDVSQILGESPQMWKEQFVHKNELLFIALFDIWTANEDRNINNANLMYDLSDGNRFIPIDHQHIFNSSSSESKLSQLTSNDSILSYQPLRQLFKKNEIQKQELVVEIRDKYYFYIDECHQNLDKILEKIPEDWNINTNDYVKLLDSQIFNQEWVEDCWENFITLLRCNFLKI